MVNKVVYKNVLIMWCKIFSCVGNTPKFRK